ncbi:MAG: T9SS type A sorting domain-containing protein [Bacteroidetes bacterium]|nr:T9SS type A sorting domain-containing protein [Bacteroidota bacterium]
MEIANENIEDGVANFQVMNVTGQVIFNGTANFSNGFMKEEINLERKFNKGLYLVKVQIGDSEMTEKVMLQ